MVRPKKHLGQHFLKEAGIAERIAALVEGTGVDQWLEIGPGTGILSLFLHQKVTLKCVEIDSESINWLRAHHPELVLIPADYLTLNPEDCFSGEFGVIGNFPYNISSQIVFRILSYKERVPVFAGMFQLELARRLASPPGTKEYGILSVLTQAYYDVQLVFRVSPGNFNPPPKVQSGVVLAFRKPKQNLDCDEELFKDVVKTAFNQRRKTLANALKKFNLISGESQRDQIFKLRAENLSVADFVELTKRIESGF